MQLVSAERVVEGFHIQVRDASTSSPKSSYDSVTISGGGTRSHTLSDLRPNSKYFIFLLPYRAGIRGKPSNLMVVETKEDGE